MTDGHGPATHACLTVLLVLCVSDGHGPATHACLTVLLVLCVSDGHGPATHACLTVLLVLCVSDGHGPATHACLTVLLVLCISDGHGPATHALHKRRPHDRLQHRTWIRRTRFPRRRHQLPEETVRRPLHRRWRHRPQSHLNNTLNCNRRMFYDVLTVIVEMPFCSQNIADDMFTACLIDLCKALWELMKSYYRTMRWHEMYDTETPIDTSKCSRAAAAKGCENKFVCFL